MNSKAAFTALFASSLALAGCGSGAVEDSDQTQGELGVDGAPAHNLRDFAYAIGFVGNDANEITQLMNALKQVPGAKKTDDGAGVYAGLSAKETGLAKDGEQNVYYGIMCAPPVATNAEAMEMCMFTAIVKANAVKLTDSPAVIVVTLEGKLGKAMQAGLPKGPSADSAVLGDIKCQAGTCTFPVSGHARNLGKLLDVSKDEEGGAKILGDLVKALF